VREIEFLPDWYPLARRRQRWLVLQGWVALLVLMGMGLWLLLARRNVSAAAADLASVDAQLAQSKLELRQLDEQLELQRQLEVQRQIVSRLGLPVEMSRLLQTLENVMPREMSVVELAVDTDEQARGIATSAMPPAAVAGASSAMPLDRRLRVRLVAVAPSDVDLANVLGGLNAVPFFESVAYSYARDKAEDGHLMREFEITFTMSLNDPIGSGGGSGGGGGD
jgi:hypothetical protein